MKYEDENGDLKEAQLDGMMSRVCQHEYRPSSRYTNGTKS